MRVDRKMLSHFGVIIHLGDIMDILILERKPQLFSAAGLLEMNIMWMAAVVIWIERWQLRWCHYGLDWTVNYIVSSASAALLTTRQTNGLLSSTFALWCNTADLHLRPASITHRNSLAIAAAVAAAVAAAAAAAGIYKLKTERVPCIFFHQPSMSVLLPSTLSLSSLCTPVSVGLIHYCSFCIATVVYNIRMNIVQCTTAAATVKLGS